MSEVTPLGNAQYFVRSADGRSTVATAVAVDGETWVFLEGALFVIPVVENRASTRPHADDPSALAAPMPATVVAINVAPGDTVADGDVIVLLEAMKMELPIKAPRPGVVAALHCRVGELVQPGVPLIELT